VCKGLYLPCQTSDFTSAAVIPTATTKQAENSTKLKGKAKAKVNGESSGKKGGLSNLKSPVTFLTFLKQHKGKRFFPSLFDGEFGLGRFDLPGPLKSGQKRPGLTSNSKGAALAGPQSFPGFGLPGGGPAPNVGNSPSVPPGGFGLPGAIPSGGVGLPGGDSPNVGNGQPSFPNVGGNIGNAGNLPSIPSIGGGIPDGPSPIVGGGQGGSIPSGGSAPSIANGPTFPSNYNKNVSFPQHIFCLLLAQNATLVRTGIFLRIHRLFVQPFQHPQRFFLKIKPAL